MRWVFGFQISRHMKHKLSILYIIVLLISQTIQAQDTNKPKAFDDFFEGKKIHQEKGHFNIYSGDNRFYIEIPDKDLGDNLLFSSHIVKGSTPDVSGQSGVYYFQKGRNNTLDLYRNVSTTFANDSVDFCMMDAIQKSGLIPAYQAFNIVALGKDKKSYIIELTQDLSATNGVFSLSNPGPLSNPDPSRSGVRSYDTIDNGVVFSSYATQSMQGQGQGGRDANYVSSYEIQMLIQKIPAHEFSLKLNHDAYGFNTVEHVVYDTKNYRANKLEYIKKWCLSTNAKGQKLQAKGIAVAPLMPIKIWIDPVTPKVFIDCVKSALSQWEVALEKAGWKDVFQIVDNNYLEYKKINFYWGFAYNENKKSMIEEPVSGEILGANINFMDESAKDALVNYFLLCGVSDQAIQNNYDDINLRKRIMVSKLSGLIGETLGINVNYPAVTAFSPKQLRNNDWLMKWGPSATVVGAQLPNYLVQKSDNINPEYLWAKVSMYDYDAIAYMYGDKTSSPKLKQTYYAKSDKLDPYAQSTFVSNDLLEASELGISNLKQMYLQLPTMVASWDKSNLNSDITKFAKQTFSMYQYFVNQEATLIGGRFKRTVIRGENEVPLTYVAKQKQVDALAALEKHVFNGAPQWLKDGDVQKLYPTDMNRFYVDMTRNILKKLVSKEVLGSLADAENQLGAKAFTCSELFAYFDRVVFHNFNTASNLSTQQMSIQLAFVAILADAANNTNVSAGVNDLSAAIQIYLIQTKENIEKLVADENINPEMKNNAKLMLLKMNRAYFNKTI